MAIKLSLLIATMPSRKTKFNRLINKIDGLSPINGTVEVLWDDSMEYNIGIKRNKLLERACGQMVVYIDDDDDISNDYIKKILKATETDPDCIGISGTITTNGKNKKQWHISKDFGSWYERHCIYFRTPNHISPVKRTIALQVKFPEISYGEDAEYSKRILPLLNTEVVITGNIYKYQYNSRK